MWNGKLFKFKLTFLGIFGGVPFFSPRTQSRLMIDKAHLRRLWVAPERRFHTTFHFSTSTNQMRQDSVLLAFGSYPWIYENVGSQIVVWHFVVCCFALFYIAIRIPEVTQCYPLLRWHNVILSSCIFQLPMDWFFRPTPSWLPPGRPTRSISCCKIELVS